MTTQVIIKAHCASNKEVLVTIKNASAGYGAEAFTMQDGEVQEKYVYDEREIIIKEVLK